jgi:hypothetical protein
VSRDRLGTASGHQVDPMFPVELQSASAAAAFRDALRRIEALETLSRAAIAEAANAVNTCLSKKGTPSQRDAVRDHLLVLQRRVEDTVEKRLDIAESVSRRMVIFDSQVATLLSTLVEQQSDTLVKQQTDTPVEQQTDTLVEKQTYTLVEQQTYTLVDQKTDMRSVPLLCSGDPHGEGARVEEGLSLTNRHESYADGHNGNDGNDGNDGNAGNNDIPGDDRGADDRADVLGHVADGLAQEESAIQRTSGAAPEGSSVIDKSLVEVNGENGHERGDKCLRRNFEVCDVSRASSDKSTSGSAIEIAQTRRAGGGRAVHGRPVTWNP